MVCKHIQQLSVAKAYIGQTAVETQNQMWRRLYESLSYLWFGFPDAEEASIQAPQQSSLSPLNGWNNGVFANNWRAVNL